ncbi:hypothetical protein EMIHUDRAFT_215002 [Emiliania huxleyi CCMP1516]|uniref:Katanin p60 ATPase-containing subunit A1 MIT domain-containing protein n=2 Tax=Emiliania huxleyi TaxID=2903 RepID=A0A0D3IIS0_EMIH1|nr:hypothetical protein EMIHUDRAFT_215002 [Emiliania huxleyi CCMP1516]EOD11155.1 hypothetical protein EMIHUDRAFT_215002 [Emiliania huxleyi CCMP1516]|eukprot:XP_005763584.1 hypothetical protein EMIHUDRAFT_215002 [Emiliania huxleyi CCMP1516]
MEHLVGLEHQLQVSRESALLGNYEASLVHFDGAISQVQRYLRTLDDPALRAKWLRAKEDLSGEFQIVKEIVAELSKLRAGSKAVPPPTAAAPPPSQLLLRPDPVAVVGGPSGAAQQRDPDVCAADAELASMIERDILERRPSVHWGDIAASRRRGADEPCA